MKKRKFKERYHVEIRYGNLSQVQSEYARSTMERILKAIDPALWFGREEHDVDQKVHYVFRNHQVGELVKEALDHECSKFVDARTVWLYRHWVQQPPRNQLALFTDIGLSICVAPGDCIAGHGYQMMNGKQTVGYFNHHTRGNPSQLGHVQRLLFHGRSIDVWNARRRFRYEYTNHQSKHYLDFDYALSKARELLSDASAIHVVNACSDVYTITRYGIEVAEFCGIYDRGAQWVFEYETIGLDIPHKEVSAPIRFDNLFEAELAYATTIHRSKRIGRGSIQQ